MPLVALALLVATGVPLVDAVKAGDRAAALALLDERVDVNAAEADGTTALHWAAHRNDLELVDRLLRAGADAGAANDYGATPMSEAAVTGNAALIEALIEAGADVESPNADGQTALMVVARAGHLDAARALLGHGADMNARERWRDQTALMWAAARSQPAMVRLLVEHGADANARSRVNDWQRQVTAEPRAIYRPAGGWTPLLYAAREGCLECARVLVDAGADLDLPDPELISPLLMAVINMRYDLAAYLIGEGAEPNTWDLWGRTPLYAAVDLNTIPRGGRPDRRSLDATTSLQIVETLIEAGANPDARLKLSPPFRNIGNDRGLDRTLTTGTTPLLRAAKALDAPAIAVLLAHGADVSLANARGITPTIAAAGGGSVDADTRGLYTTGNVEARSIASLELLLAAGGDINGREDFRGLTPLHEAARWGWNDVVRFLVERGASLNATDDRGMTPVDSAMGRAGGNSRGGQRIDVHEDTAVLLEELGARAGNAR